MKCHNIISEGFQVTTPQSDVNKKCADIIANTNSVCIHVRRGDYVTDPWANQVHGTRISVPYEVHHMNQNGPDEYYDDLHLMMSCKHFFTFIHSYSL